MQCERSCAERLRLQPGDVCCFASYTFHTSRPNTSSSLRRVHYASWSHGAVHWGIEARRRILKTMARQPTAPAPDRRYELLRALRPSRTVAQHVPSSFKRSPPPLMFAVPVAVLPAETEADEMPQLNKRAKLLDKKKMGRKSYSGVDR